MQSLHASNSQLHMGIILMGQDDNVSKDSREPTDEEPGGMVVTLRNQSVSAIYKASIV